MSTLSFPGSLLVKTLILHGTQFPVDVETAHIVCMLPGRTFMNDMIMERLPEEGQAIVTIE